MSQQSSEKLLEEKSLTLQQHEQEIRDISSLCADLEAQLETVERHLAELG